MFAIAVTLLPTEPAGAQSEVGAEPAPKSKPPPYSLPFQLRPAVAASVVRYDTELAFYRDPVTHDSGSTMASMLLVSYKVTEQLAPLVRLGWVWNSPAELPPLKPTPKSAVGFLNPVVGALYALKLSPELKLAFFLGLTVPVGSGGGNSPDPARAAANRAGIPARSAMDNSMFAVNDFAVFPGVDFAYVAHGFTAQVEATLFQLTRVRGDAPAVPDASRTNFTTGLHLGYFFAPFISVGAELRHQRWLSTPKAVENDPTHTLRDTTTVAFGPRFHIPLGEKTWLRPAVALVLPLDNPMADARYKIVQIDVPFAF
ncbi:MAG TPA: hypothetical protein VGJ84_04605 [Polyangiaceae bacterium]|jgi:hypothetical protein